jgi:hypothetical protein
MLLKYRFGEEGDKYQMRYKVQFPFMSDARKKLTPKDMKAFAEEFLKSNSDKGDEKYVTVKRADLDMIWYEFDADKWIDDALRAKKPFYDPPISLTFRYWAMIPRFIFVNAMLMDLNHHMNKKFEQYIRKNVRVLFHDSFKFLQKITPELFEYKVDFQKAVCIASLKYSVILGSLALYLMYRHKKEFDKDQVKFIKDKVSKFGDVGKLDSFIRKL